MVTENEVCSQFHLNDFFFFFFSCLKQRFLFGIIKEKIGHSVYSALLPCLAFIFTKEKKKKRKGIFGILGLVNVFTQLLKGNFDGMERSCLQYVSKD